MEHFDQLYQALNEVVGYIYPNEIELRWSILIVLYPYITGLVAGAFILASLNRVFDIKELKPTYEISLLAALAFLLVATMPLISHLGHPERFYELMMTPHSSSAMAIFGFVYIWYLMVVLLLEIWFDYRRDFVVWSQESKGLKKFLYKILTLGSNDISPKALKLDDKLGYIITVVGIPSAFLLHGYVGFIFGSVKANPWWSSVMMPVIFLFSAMVSGIALVLVTYMVINYLRKQKIDMQCLDAIGKYLFYIIIIDFTLESLDQIHRIYEAEESFDIISLLISGKLFFTLSIMQVLVGTLIPLFILGFFQFYKPKEIVRKAAYFTIGIFVLVGIFFMRWNVVIGGQLFSKSFYGFTSYKIGLIGGEGMLAAGVWMIVPILILIFLLWLLPPWKKQHS
ncbi:oxidoreductase, membrane subunit [hydrothermal vent metagenome]|uniref:Oxidoreductase, membrane subunit n=1 Tax=hydrothermal vent metagenome TaxID=652676 RepID=A0A3B0TMD5_9ZZZZ